MRVSGDDEVNGHGKWAKLLSVELNHLKFMDMVRGLTWFPLSSII